MTAALPSIGPTEPPPGEPPIDERPFVIGSWNDPTGVMGRRIGAFVLDVLLSVLLTLLAVLAAGGFEEQQGAISCTQFPGTVCLSLNENVFTGTTATTWAILLTPLLYALFFSVIVQGRTGATPGKALFELRVVDAEGQGPGLGRAAGRTVFLLIDGLPCCLPLVGLITASTSAGHRRVGDMVATTFVVDRHDTGRSVLMPGQVRTPTGLPPAGVPGGFVAAPLAGVPVGAPAPPGPPQPQPQPQWDATRGTYVLWDPARGTWLAFDQEAGVWRAI